MERDELDLFLIIKMSEHIVEVSVLKKTRDMEYFKKVLGAKDFMRGFVAFGVLTFTMLYVAGITFLQVPKENVRFADTIMGFLMGTGFTGIIAFYFGTSKGSVDKNKIIHQQQSHENDGNS